MDTTMRVMMEIALFYFIWIQVIPGSIAAPLGKVTLLLPYYHIILSY